MIEKDCVGITPARRPAENIVADGPIGFQRLFRFAAVRDDALLVALAAHAQHLLLPVHVGKVQAGQLADAQPGSIEQF